MDILIPNSAECTETKPHVSTWTYSRRDDYMRHLISSQLATSLKRKGSAQTALKHHFRQS